MVTMIRLLPNYGLTRTLFSNMFIYLYTYILYTYTHIMLYAMVCVFGICACLVRVRLGPRSRRLHHHRIVVVVYVDRKLVVAVPVSWNYVRYNTYYIIPTGQDIYLFIM